MGGFAYGAGGRTQPAPRDQFEGVLGTELVAGWHGPDGGAGLVGGEVNTVRDRYRGILMTAPAAGQRPTWPTDGSNFHGQRLFGCLRAAARCLAVGGLAANIASGRPCIWIRYRMLTVPISTADPLVLFGLGVAAASDTYRGGPRGTGAVCVGPNFYMGGASPIVTGPAAADTAVHTMVYWLDGTNANIRIDSTLFTAASGALAAGTTAASIGKAASGNYHFTDAYIAAVLIARSYPGATKEAAITQQLVATY